MSFCSRPTRLLLHFTPRLVIAHCGLYDTTSISSARCQTQRKSLTTPFLHFCRSHLQLNFFRSIARSTTPTSLHRSRFRELGTSASSQREPIENRIKRFEWISRISHFFSPSPSSTTYDLYCWTWIQRKDIGTDCSTIFDRILIIETSHSSNFHRFPQHTNWLHRCARALFSVTECIADKRVRVQISGNTS